MSTAEELPSAFSAGRLEPRRSAGSTGATFDRRQTMEVLERAAAALLREEGVLAGLNLRLVAERAGVNRGLVYHYFGSRRDLLRSSLRRGYEDTRVRVTLPDEPGPPGEMFRSLFHAALEERDRWRMVALLLLDDDRGLSLMREGERATELVERGKQIGIIDESLDVDDARVLIWSIVYGYSLIRGQAARELKIKARDLDDRVEAMLETIFGAYDGPEAED